MQVSHGFASLETAKLNFSKFPSPVATPKALGNPDLDISEFREKTPQPAESQATVARPLLEISIATWKHHSQFQIQGAILEIK